MHWRAARSAALPAFILVCSAAILPPRAWGSRNASFHTTRPQLSLRAAGCHRRAWGVAHSDALQVERCRCKHGSASWDGSLVHARRRRPACDLQPQVLALSYGQGSVVARSSRYCCAAFSAQKPMALSLSDSLRLVRPVGSPSPSPLLPSSPPAVLRMTRAAARCRRCRRRS